jgi:CTP:phosphocholine cytidylyltransferase-like protein
MNSYTTEKGLLTVFLSIGIEKQISYFSEVVVNTGINLPNFVPCNFAILNSRHTTMSCQNNNRINFT